jgi:hypothetical protein
MPAVIFTDVPFVGITEQIWDFAKNENATHPD